MRISVDCGDRAFSLDAMGTRVYLDGVEVPEVVTADEELGQVVRYVTDEHGSLIFDHVEGMVQREVLHGSVVLVLPPEFRFAPIPPGRAKHAI